MNDKKKQLIRHLRQGGRKKLTEISTATNIPVSTLFDMIHNLQRQGVTCHSTLLDFSKVGFHHHMFVALKTLPTNRLDLQIFLRSLKNVNCIYHINSGHDFLIDVVCKNQKEAQQFLDTLDSSNKISEKSVFNIIDTIQKEKFLTDEEHFQ